MMAARNTNLANKMIQQFFSLNPIGDPSLRLAPTATGGLGLPHPSSDPENELERLRIEEEENRNYPRCFQEEEEKELRSHQKSTRGTDPDNLLTPLSQLSAIDENSTIGELADINNLQQEETGQIYENYYRRNVNIKYDPNLVISRHKDQILNKIRTHPVVIIRGSTGCGKTTQVPQYILDEHAARGIHCNIIVTQPRRIAAISVARRVCQERKWELGRSPVGYQIALDSVTCPDTRITYMTTGVLLQKLIAAKNMHTFTHVIIDEVHERDQDTDLALLVVRKLLRTNSMATKVILMSATIDTDLFANYFGSVIQGRVLPAVSVDIESKPHEVLEHYITELGPLGEIPVLDPDTPCIPPESYHLAYKLIVTFDRVEEMEQSDEEGPIQRSSILIFLPGYEEIVQMRSRLQKDQDAKKWWILPLHSSITIDEQQKVFNSPQPGYRKIILSTNIAESSITVPDIRYVIDFCLTKILVSDPSTNYCSLQVQWASKANCDQRKGRAGRVSQGKVYRMVSASFYYRLEMYGMPEMKRCPLELVVLRVKKLELGPPISLLALALEPPELDDIKRAILVLKEVGALTLTVNDTYTALDGDLTFIGDVMSQMPLDVRITKLILLGFVFDRLEECIIMAASLSVINFFSKPFQEMLKCYKSRLSWASDTFSDVLAYLAAYSVWQKHCQEGFFKRPMGGNRPRNLEEDWAKKSYIQLRRIREVKALVEELKRRLLKVGIKTIPMHIPNDPLQDVDSVLILKMVICGAFYPNYFTQEEMEQKEIFKQLSNLNPRNTVVVTGLPAKHSILYESAIVSLFRECSPHVQVHFDDCRAYVQFGKNTGEIGTGVMQEVYVALKMRHQRNALSVPSLSQDEVRQKLKIVEDLKAEHRARSTGLTSSRLNSHLTQMTMPRVRLPALDKITLRLHVSCVVDCGHFWAQYMESENVPGLEAFLKEKINLYDKNMLKSVKLPLTRGQLVLAPFNEGPDQVKYYRACIESIKDTNNVEVFFLDYGNTATVTSAELRDIDSNLGSEILTTPALAVQCMLSEIRPAATQTTRFGHWNKKATDWFKEYCYLREFMAQVYSVVQGVIRLELVSILDSGQEVNVNKHLIQMGYAEPAVEDYMSVQNHELRLNSQNMDASDVTKLNVQQQEDNVVRLAARNSGLSSNPLLNLRGTGHEISLRGPNSPLEVSYCGVTKLTRGRRIKIERDSVNSVTLNREPQDPHSCMLVASYVGLDSSASAIVARNTTEMPSIHGLPTLMTLLFAPTAEFRTDPKRTKYTGALAGLGYNQKNESIYPDHDVEMAFDTVFDNTDIIDINKVRICMNLILGSSGTESQRGPAVIKECQNRAKHSLLKLLSRPRTYQEPVVYRHQFAWNKVPEQYLIPIPFPDPSYDVPYLFRVYQAIELADKNSWVKRELEQLKVRAKEPLTAEVNKCPICEVTIYTRVDLRLHLLSAEHEKKERYFVES